MGKIVQLDEHLSNKIAAGEVVERPASVVKELVENSIDANATRIEIEVEEGGLSLIRVLDNGDGIEPDDCVLAFNRHATSKIKSEQDLIQIKTMGFRGEALPSISSVAQVELKSSTGKVLVHICSLRTERSRISSRRIAEKVQISRYGICFITHRLG